MNEQQTRLDYIDPALRAAGWGVIEGSRIRVEFPITAGRLVGQNRRTHPLKADYILIYRNRRLAVVEAKPRDKAYTEGVGQAKDYAQRLNIRYTYATNGLRIYSMDIVAGTEGEVKRFPTPDELWEMTYPAPKEAYKIEIENWKERFDAILFEDRGGSWSPRYYQHNAIYKVLYAIAEKKERLLLTMATGTGKTATAFQICWKLFHAKWNLKRDKRRTPRILFLADRNILANQAFNAFSAFDKIDENIKVRIVPSEIKKKGHVPKNGSIFFTIFQTFMSGPDDSPYFGEYPEDFFDFIIIDECHRGGSNDESSWREIMEHFSPAVQLGLTATPKRKFNADTYKYFGDPVYTYALKDGINDGFLTPFRVKEIQTNYDEYIVTSDDVILDGVAEVGDVFTYRDYGRNIIIQQVEKYRVQFFLDLIQQNQKTLVFCATQRHAAIIRDLINQCARSKNTDYCHRVTADDGAIGDQHLRDFQDNEKNIPTILTTSEKLSTGVDAPEIRNIVLLRPVNSMVEFKQIVGRGTRLFDGKYYFTIFDFVRAHNHFKDPEWDGEPEPPTYPEPKPIGPGGGVEEPEPCPECLNDPCVCEKPVSKIIRVKLSDYKAREIDATVKTSFYSPSGKPIGHQEFMESLFGDLTNILKDEQELARIWSLPSTRKKLLEELNEKGYTRAQLNDLRKLVQGAESDLFDVLSYVAYHKNLVPRLARAERAKIQLMDYDAKQQEFLNFVLEQYIRDGVNELDDQKLPELLKLKYKEISDAQQELGSIQSIRAAFIGFQEYLYKDKAS